MSSNAPPPPTDSSSGGGLSPGLLIGIIGGGTVLLIIAVIMIYWIYCRPKPKLAPESQWGNQWTNANPANNMPSVHLKSSS